MQGVNPATVVGRYIDECWNRGRIELVDELVTGDFVDHLPFSDTVPDGIDGLKAVIRLVRRAFSGLRIGVEDMITEDDRVVVRFHFSGRHDGIIAAHVATQREILLDGIVIFRVDDHRICDQWLMFDLIGLMQQMEAPEALLAVRR